MPPAQKTPRNGILITVALGLALGLQSCGYHFRSEKTSQLAADGVERIYIKGIRNETYKPGIEQFLIDGLTKSLVTSGSVRLVQDPSSADAILEGVVKDARYYMTTPTTTEAGIAPKSIIVPSAVIAAEYEAILSCTFTLWRTSVNIDPHKEKPLFDQRFTNTKRFPGSNQKASYGTTSSLINESEFTRALGELTTNMMRDVQEALVSRF